MSSRGLGRRAEGAGTQATTVPVRAATGAPAFARSVATGWATHLGLEGEFLFDLRLLVSELVSNAVRHAAEPIELELEASAERVRVVVRDGGDGFDEFLPVPSSDDAARRGLYVVHRLASDWGIERGPPFGVWFELERPASWKSV
jgi:anti-sigma regulatory factor (Ser/Thr protein kinase)